MRSDDARNWKFSADLLLFVGLAQAAIALWNLITFDLSDFLLSLLVCGLCLINVRMMRREAAQHRAKD